jgi:hypothetical protein
MRLHQRLAISVQKDERDRCEFPSSRLVSSLLLYKCMPLLSSSSCLVAWSLPLQ